MSTEKPAIAPAECRDGASCGKSGRGRYACAGGKRAEKRTISSPREKEVPSLLQESSYRMDRDMVAWSQLVEEHAGHRSMHVLLLSCVPASKGLLLGYRHYWHRSTSTYLDGSRPRYCDVRKKMTNGGGPLFCFARTQNPPAATREKKKHPCPRPDNSPRGARGGSPHEPNRSPHVCESSTRDAELNLSSPASLQERMSGVATHYRKQPRRRESACEDPVKC